MAFTIRKLDLIAEENLKRLLDNNKSVFKTKTSAIEYVLSNYYRTEKYVKKIEKENEELGDKLYAETQKLEEIKGALSILKNF